MVINDMNSERRGFDPTREPSFEKVEPIQPPDHQLELKRQMYSVPGIEPVTQSDLDQYERSKRLLDAKTDDRLRRGIQSDRPHVRNNTVLSVFGTTSLDLRNTIIEAGMADQEPNIRFSAVKNCSALPESNRIPLLEKALQDRSIYVRFEAAK